MSELTYERAKEEGIEIVYTIANGPSLVASYLNWDEDCVYDMNSNYCDDIESIRHFFEIEPVYEELDDAYEACFGIKI